MKREREKLLEELWEQDAEGRRTAILNAGAQALRRRRWIRRSQQCCAGLLVLLAASFAVKQFTQPPETAVVSQALSIPKAAPAPAHSLTDEELLALFPDTPVGLATLSDGKKRLMFLRPEDEEKFVGRL